MLNNPFSVEIDSKIFARAATAQTVAHKEIKYANVRLPDAFQDYCFLTDLAFLKIGDTVVVETIHGMKIGKFTGYIQKFPVSFDKAKWVVQKLDVETHKRRAAHMQDVKRALKQQELQQQINEHYEAIRQLEQKLISEVF